MRNYVTDVRWYVAGLKASERPYAVARLLPYLRRAGAAFQAAKCADAR